MNKHKRKSKTAITDAGIDDYANSHTTAESDDLLKLIKSSDEELEFIDMISGRQVGQLLRTLIRVGGAERVLEIGTFTGYSALMMAEVLPATGELITIEMNIRYQALAEKHFFLYDKKGVIRLIKGNAREVMPHMNEKFDLIYIDADKISYPFYYEQAIRLIKQNGVVVVDNTLWDGTVLKPDNPKAEALDRFNKLVHKDPRVEQVLLPVRDGLLIINKV
ncbi:O-methyltransferase [Balneola sp. MJW-20]|uniref:O-methyltransferase n=1 Tax=Gracilimonas aurantiaca TaxID=3234185 RepID=UPI003466129F